MKGKHIPFENLKVGMIVICGDEQHSASSCWTRIREPVACRIDKVDYTLQFVWRSPISGLSLDNPAPNNDGSCGCDDRNHLYEWIDENITNNLTPNFMSTISEKLALAFKPEPQKTFRKLGITNGDDILTDDGVKLYLSWKFQIDQQKFCDEVAKPLLEEQEKESKK